MTPFRMPRLSDSMEEGTIVEWLVQDGQEVVAGEPLIEIETDKATVTHVAESTGTLHRAVSAGETVAVGEIIGFILDRGESPEHVAQSTPVPTPSGNHAPASGPASAPAPAPTPAPEDRPFASPLARRVASDLGVTLAGLRGSGPRGRIVLADVEAMVAQPPPPTAAPADSSPAVRADASPAADVKTVELTPVQQTIASRMSASNATIPDFQLTMDVDVGALLDLRDQMRDASLQVSVNDFVVRASALALKVHPRANGAFREGVFRLNASVSVGVAVAAPDALFVPVVHDADTKSLSRIGEEVRRLAQRAREGALTPPELCGATFTVSNLGMFGVTSFTAMVNPGQAAILAVGAVRDVLALDDDQVIVRKVLALSLSCDHRILYGADAAALLADVRAALEQPLSLAG